MGIKFSPFPRLIIHIVFKFQVFATFFRVSLPLMIPVTTIVIIALPPGLEKQYVCFVRRRKEQGEQIIALIPQLFSDIFEWISRLLIPKTLLS